MGKFKAPEKSGIFIQPTRLGVREDFIGSFAYDLFNDCMNDSDFYTAFNNRGNRAISVHRTEYFSHTAGLTAASRMSHAR
jgi:hypothetical protein